MKHAAFSSLVLASLLAHDVAAQTACQSTIGPDLIVSDISQLSNFASVNAVEALGVRAWITNVGTSTAAYQASTAAHPVYGQSLYRHAVVDGAPRFEQIGTSWLKHGFLALSQSGVCTCTSTDGTTLGVGCTENLDVGGSSGLTTLGPRWQVQAHAGTFPFPAANPPLLNANSRRLQVDETDLASPGARYFVAVRTLAADESAAQNVFNDVSTRELSSVGSPGAYTFSFAAPVRREETPLETWRSLDPAVVLTSVDVPGEGRFQLAQLVTDLGNGHWRYEYALYNHDSDVAARSLSVTIGAGALTSNVGFHDVTYRDGDGLGGVNQSPVDWVATPAGGTLTWSTASFAQDPNANALRWDSTYNFRLDADAPPVAGVATIGLFKPHATTSVTVNVLVPGEVPGILSVACAGDGSGSACPCGNESTPSTGGGCTNSLASGGSLRGIGTPSVSTDTLVLQGSGMPSSSVLYFEGTALAVGGAGVAFGDGLRCAAGTLVRLRVHTNVGGASSHPGAGDAPISVATGASAGAVRHYQAWYRDAASFCASATFNLTNALSVLWRP